jgi:hypothetical protein
LAREVESSEVAQGLLSLLDDFTAPFSIYAGAARAVKKNPEAFISEVQE